tara:strand:+ start:25415 stop:26344 length:930 start_codon:yes stop_codon:yes gene_type:complete
LSNGKTVALALGSGAARGYTHIGVIEALEARGYEIVAISGCSMGAVVGGFYAAGKLKQYRDWVCTLTYMDVLKLVDVSLLSNGVIRGDKLYNRMEAMLNGQLIEDLSIPFTAVSVDLKSKKEVWFQNGPLNQAIRSSAAIPSIFAPVCDDAGRTLVDGAVLNPLPITPCMSAHADYIMAVDLNSDLPMPDELLPDADNKEGRKLLWMNSLLDKASQWIENKTNARKQADENLGKLDILNQVFEVMSSSLTQYKVAGYPPDLLIRMPVKACEVYEFYRAEEVIETGRHIADEALDEFEKGNSSRYGRIMG